MNPTLFQLRVYTLRSHEGLTAYQKIWDKHIPSLAKHRISVHRLWVKTETPQFAALVSYATGDDPEERDKAYMSSTDFQSDMRGFDMSQIENVVGTLLRVSGDMAYPL